MANVFNDDAYKKEIQTKIKHVFEENGKICVDLDDNIFYPKGGGQKGDKGVLIYDDKRIKVVDTIKDQYDEAGAILIVETKPEEGIIGKDITAKIDWEFRYRQMKLHSALHLYHCLIEKVLGKKINNPITADIQDSFAFSRYENQDITEEVVNSATKELVNLISPGAEIKTYPDPEKAGWRWWECLGYKIPCGGTHVRDAKEIGNIEVKFSTKKGNPTINISLI